MAADDENATRTSAAVTSSVFIENLGLSPLSIRVRKQYGISAYCYCIVRCMNTRIASLLLVAIVFAGPAATAQQNFDAVVSGVDVFGGCFILPFSESVVQWVNPLRVEYGDVEM